MSNLRIINIVDGTVLYFYPGNIKDVSEIKNFTKSISDKIINDLIYFNTFGKTRSEEKTAEYPSIVERKDNKKNKTKNVNIAIFPEYIYPLGSFGNIVEKGYGIGIYGGLENFPFKNFNTGIEIGINKLDRKNNQSCYFIEIPLLLKINYLYNIFNFFYVAPEFKVGPVFFYYQSNKNTTSKDYNKYAIEIMSQAGIVLGKKINDNINISINVGYGIIFEEESLLNFLSFSIAIGYRF